MPGPCGLFPEKEGLDSNRQTLARTPNVERIKGILERPFQEKETLCLLRNRNAAIRNLGLAKVASLRRVNSLSILAAVTNIALNRLETPSLRYLAIVVLGDAGTLAVSHLKSIFLEKETGKVYYSGTTLNEHVSGKPPVSRSLQVWAASQLTGSTAGKQALRDVAFNSKPSEAWFISIAALYDVLNGDNEVNKDILEMVTETLWKNEDPAQAVWLMEAMVLIYERELEYKTDTAPSVRDSLASYSVAKQTVSANLRALARQKLQAMNRSGVR